jgi:hypothetical protein
LKELLAGNSDLHAAYEKMRKSALKLCALMDKAEPGEILRRLLEEGYRLYLASDQYLVSPLLWF